MLFWAVILLNLLLAPVGLLIGLALAVPLLLLFIVGVFCYHLLQELRRHPFCFSWARASSRP